ncbi:DUF805 domain-containing protein [Lactovum odontotermitis]
MATKYQWHEYFKLLNNREPSLEEFQAAIEKGEIDDMTETAVPQTQTVSVQPNPAQPQSFFPRRNTAVPTSKHSVSLFESYKLFWKNYVNFTGRSRRSEFWWTYLINAIISFILSLPFLLAFFVSFFSIFNVYSYGYGLNRGSLSTIAGPLFALIPAILFGLAILIPLLAIYFRRLRDAGLATMNIVGLIVFHVILYILSFIPFVGFLFDLAILALDIYVLVLLTRESDYYLNRPEPMTDWFARLFK